MNGSKNEVLEPILALLVSFAGLADRVAGQPLSIALPALAFLAQGEAVARSFIIGLPSGTPALVAASQAADRAERLAADFRALARILRALLARLRRRARFAGPEADQRIGSTMAPRGRSGQEPHPPAAPPAPDTS